YEALIDLSQKISLVLANKDVKTLMELTEMESVILGELFRLREEVQFKDSLENAEGLTEEANEIMKGKIAYLGALIMKLNDVSKTNSRLLEENLNLINKYIDIVKKNPSLNNLLIEGRG
ncbi:MAG: hypothetical protein ACP5RW_09250, partial [bacterium]